MQPSKSTPTRPLFAVEFSPWIRRVAIVLLLIFALAPLFALFAPWRQNVSGAGQVAAYTPVDRPQDVQAPVQGRVVEVFVQEADLVQAGDPLVRIVDIDPDKIERIETKLGAAQQDLRLTEQSVEVYRSQVATLEGARDLAVEAFQARIEAAVERVRSAEQSLRAAEADLTFAAEQEARLERLVPEFVEELKLLEARARRTRSAAAVESARADVEAARASFRNAEAELGRETAQAEARVDDARARMQGEAAKAASTRARIADLEGDLRAQNTQLVNAPRAGRIMRLNVAPQASVLKQGDVLLQIVPLAKQTAVELWVRGVAAPLIEAGRHVRLQFEGWPAIQFVGWPSVAVGTFGGVVARVDPTDSGQGRFRLLILPDPEEPAWPDERWLRQGVRAKGWVLLNEVSLGYELWRQLNGFPPTISLQEPEPKANGEGF
ncbi:MAG: HlyD family secretion protein [Planctomycetota bacterium]